MTWRRTARPRARRGPADGWIDVSVPIVTGMAHWPDNPPVKVERMLDMSKGDAANVSALSCGVHTGTHCDAPVHFKTPRARDRQDAARRHGRAGPDHPDPRTRGS